MINEKFPVHFPMWCRRANIKADMTKRHWFYEMVQVSLANMWKKCEHDHSLTCVNSNIIGSSAKGLRKLKRGHNQLISRQWWKNHLCKILIKL